ncbi:M28 family metallopeptidase [Winogradskyella vincentii]|uniref:M28 family peptidase n=1 Tax=Winogradskyella vincentii TaxID=2877122 RepID=A0ABS7Y2X8_9FLAO|nr:M28 family peptidase [Winogradskyella vincentii]MCA0153966.1 M28 family peptidase [Winogradskyella vincentii]
MKIILSIFSLFLVFSCSVRQKGLDGASGNDGSLTKVEVSANSIKTSMEYLASDELNGRATGSDGIEKAAVFIESYFKGNNIKPFFENYRDNFTVKRNVGGEGSGEVIEIKGYNIVGFVEGNDPKLKNEFVILGGHYDHIGQGREVEGDSIANGANDDASGTITAMELGRYFSKTKSNKRSLLITLFAAEEMGLKGSAHLAERLKSQGLNVYTMINFEMVGVPRAEGKSMAYMSGFERSNFAPKLNEYAGEEVVGFFPKAKEFQLFFRSDNFPFYKELNIPAHAISTFDFTNYEYYHHVDDEADKMDYEHMASFTNKMAKAFEGILNSPNKEVVLNEE